MRLKRKDLIVITLLFLVAVFLITSGIYAQESQKKDMSKEDWAIGYFTRAIEQNPKDCLNYYNRGLNFRNKGEFEKAIADFTKALEINPKDSIHQTALYARMETYFLMKDYDNAWKDLHEYEMIIADNLQGTVMNTLLQSDLNNFKKNLQEASGREQ